MPVSLKGPAEFLTSSFEQGRKILSGNGRLWRLLPSGGNRFPIGKSKKKYFPPGFFQWLPPGVERREGPYQWRHPAKASLHPGGSEPSVFTFNGENTHLMKLRSSFSLALAFCLSVLSSNGQAIDAKDFARYTSAEGLTNDYVSSVLQDSIGYVWLATPSGLNRFDGSRFIQFHATVDSLSLAAEDINWMTWIDGHRLAVFTAGVHIIDTRTGARRNLFIPYSDMQYEYKFNMIEAVRGDREGNVYVLTRSGFYHFDKDYRMISRFDYYKEAEVPTEHFFFGRDLLRLDEHRLLIVSAGGLFLYDKRMKRVKPLEAKDEPMLAEFIDYPGTYYTLYRFFQHSDHSLVVLHLLSDSLAYIDLDRKKKTVSRLPFPKIRNEFHYRSRLFAESDSTFFITGHFSGFFRFHLDPASGHVSLDPQRYFPSFSCNGLLIDQDKNLWVATNKGTFRRDAARLKVEVGALRQGLLDSFPQLRLDDLYVGSRKIYAGTRGQAGLLIINKETLGLEGQYFGQDSIMANPIYSLEPIDNERLMIGISGPIQEFNMVTGKGKTLNPPAWNYTGDWTSDLFTDSREEIWVSAANIYRYKKNTKVFDRINHILPSPVVPFAIREDTAGNMWIAAHGIIRYNVTLDSFDIVLDSFPSIKMRDNQVNAVVIDRDNTIWFNSNNNGLAGYSIDKGTFRHFTRSDGLPDDNIAAMRIVGNKLWIACFTGIACMDLNSYRITSFGQEDGFPAMQVVKGSEFFYDSAASQLYLGLTYAVVRFNPFNVLLRKAPPRLFIEKVVVNGRKEYFLPGNRMEISWKGREVMVTIGSINFSSGNSQAFAYRILREGQTQWQQLGSQPGFSISNLSPGTYTIQVKSYSVHNRWPEQVREFSIVVLPPFWQKEWFIALMTILAAVGIYRLIAWRADVARKKEMKNTHLQKLKAEGYKNQFELEQISNYFSSSLAGKKTEDEVLWDVTGNLIGRLGYVDCMIYLWNEDKTRMVQKAAYGPKGKPEIISTQVFDVRPGQGIVGHVVSTRQPILVKDTRKDERYRVDEEFRLSEICVPIIHNGELMGIIDSEHYEPGYFSERDIKILTTIATLIGNKLTQIASERTLDAKRKEIDNINEQLVGARLAALQAQMNPHFVFNALNSIKRMILDRDNEKASRYLSKFALMIRMTLDHSKSAFVTLHENIEYLKSYLEMEQLRFDDSFRYYIDIGEDLEPGEIYIPSLMMQPIVENAIWHGLMAKEGEKETRICFQRRGSRICCRIEDNGIGVVRSEEMKKVNRPLHRSLGLDNLRNRIRIMNEKYDLECRLDIVDLNHAASGSTGTRVTLEFNIINV